ncbi:proline-rich proteoglycan 2-like [Pipra filicauda]|uniref:Proline-rich proteoglycan 2-like n=1 Tax=Pipra filicauda TaxID=649802 RepID=A0A7R5KX24_9PASS|nr:proline-rich proteoglycan 2-like [Pipra filicauda]
MVALSKAKVTVKGRVKQKRNGDDVIGLLGREGGPSPALGQGARGPALAGNAPHEPSPAPGRLSRDTPRPAPAATPEKSGPAELSPSGRESRRTALHRSQAALTFLGPPEKAEGSGPARPAPEDCEGARLRRSRGRAGSGYGPRLRLLPWSSADPPPPPGLAAGLHRHLPAAGRRDQPAVPRLAPLTPRPLGPASVSYYMSRSRPPVVCSSRRTASASRSEEPHGAGGCPMNIFSGNEILFFKEEVTRSILTMLE